MTASFVPVMTSNAKSAIATVARSHVRNCGICTLHRRRRKSENTEVHRAEIRTLLVKVTGEHGAACYTCKTRGEAGIAEHQRAAVRIFHYASVLL